MHKKGGPCVSFTYVSQVLPSGYPFFFLCRSRIRSRASWRSRCIFLDSFVTTATRLGPGVPAAVRGVIVGPVPIPVPAKRGAAVVIVLVDAASVSVSGFGALPSSDRISRLLSSSPPPLHETTAPEAVYRHTHDPEPFSVSFPGVFPDVSASAVLHTRHSNKNKNASLRRRSGRQGSRSVMAVEHT